MNGVDSESDQSVDWNDSVPYIPLLGWIRFKSNFLAFSAGEGGNAREENTSLSFETHCKHFGERDDTIITLNG